MPANFCPNCGKPLAPNARFCGECGAKIVITAEENKAVNTVINSNNEPILYKKDSAELNNNNVQPVSMQETVKHIPDIAPAVKELPAVQADKNGDKQQAATLADSAKEKTDTVATQVSGFGDKYMNNKTFKEKKEFLENTIFTTEGRLNRKPYILYSIAITVIMAISALLCGTVILAIVGIPLFVACCVANVMTAIRRLHDLNHSGWLYLIMAAPYVNIVFGLYVMCWKGTTGSNKYGPDPLQQNM